MKLNEKRYGTDNWLKQPDKKEDFISWTSLGVDNPNDENWLSYEEAQKIVQKAGIKSCQEYYNWKERPSNIPAHPDRIYKKEWNGWGGFLGTDFLSYHETQKTVQQSGIKTSTEYYNWKERPFNIPSTPNTVYKNEWNGWGGFLGTGNGTTNFLFNRKANEILQKYLPKNQSRIAV